MTDSDFMAEAVRLAREGVSGDHGGPFGAVVVSDGDIVGAAHNRVVSKNDPTAHAEVEAIRAACAALGSFSLAGCEIYTTCEPCPMCLAAIHWARLEAVHFAMTRADAAAAGFDDAALYQAMANPTVSMQRVERPDAAEVFELWAQKADRTQY